MSRLNVLVVGASVAGPTTAYWLARAGANVTIIERYPSLRAGGQSIDIRTTGVGVMRKMPGMEAAVRAKRPPMDAWALIDAKGKNFATIKPTGNPDEQAMISEFEIFRGDLAQILYDMTKDHERINYVFDEQVTSLKQAEDGKVGPVKVEFMNGQLPTAEYDLVVACDGSTSRTRALALNCGVRDHITHDLSGWAAYFSIPKDLVDGSTAGAGLFSVGGRMIGVGQDLIPGKNRVTMMAWLPKDKPGASEPFRGASKAGTQALKQYVADYHRGAGWKTDEIIELMMESDDFYASELVRVKVPHITKGSFALVGDAGYSSGVGSGTTLALTGGYILAGEICKQKGDLAAALKAYEDVMAPIVQKMQAIPPGFPGIMAPQTAWGLKVRNAVLMVGSRVINLLSPLLGASMSSADKFHLPEYDWTE